MTNPTPHGQVPEALIDLIDAYAETRHRCGGIYNTKTAAARQAVIEALSGVQALSAAPVEVQSPWSRALEIRMAQGWKLKGDRVPVLYTDSINGEGVGRDDLWLCTTKALAASPTPTPPAEQQAAPKAVLGDQRKAFESWARRQSWIKDCGKAPDGDAYGHWDTQKAWLAWAAALAAPQQEVSQDTLYLLRRLLSNQHTLTGPELRAELEKIVGEAYQQEAQEPALFVSPKQLAALTDPDDPEGEHGRYLPARKTSRGLFTQPLYTAPQPAPAPLSDDTKRLAWMADGWTPGHEKLYAKHVLETGGVGDLDDLRTFIDKQIAAQVGSNAE